ncbi:MAG: ATP-binding protein [Candidatus Methylarchaceae archaeon HK02M1]|nr:ATP-binding protein [Candidatus Methylarchaceae archaeon HK02M1]
MSLPKVFDDMEGRLEARLRDHKMMTRTSKMREGEITLTSSIAVLEVKFNFKVLDRLHNPAFIAIERRTSEGRTYLIYEVIALRPTHFQMLGMDVAMPTIIRKEYLDTISSSWGESEETWIDVVAIPTQYKMDLREDEPTFSKSKLIPLTGSMVYLLSKDTVNKFLCVEDGIGVGNIIGFDMPLTVNIENMVRYHTGIFGFTGVGKSNLTSYLIRRAMNSIQDLKVVVFDVAGEYSIHLLDILQDGIVFSTDDFGQDAYNFLCSQAIPETLELNEKTLVSRIQALFDEERIHRLSQVILDQAPEITLEYVMSALQSASDSRGSGRIQATLALKQLMQCFLREKMFDPEILVAQLNEEDRGELAAILTEVIESVHGMSSIKLDLTSLVDYIKSAEEEEVAEAEASHLNPKRLASFVLSPKTPRLNIIYLPEPDTARLVVSRFLDRLLLLKKTSGVRRKVLIVLDEAQEFIPDRMIRSDFTDSSNRAVEALLRQGRKYRAYCWISTQRVAHLNVNALQQLHSYFVSTLPRFYDRMVIADSFSLSYDVLDKTTELDTGEWLFVSYKATKQKNVPVFIKAPDNEELLTVGISRME